MPHVLTSWDFLPPPRTFAAGDVVPETLNFTNIIISQQQQQNILRLKRYLKIRWKYSDFGLIKHFEMWGLEGGSFIVVITLKIILICCHLRPDVFFSSPFLWSALVIVYLIVCRSFLFTLKRVCLGPDCFHGPSSSEIIYCAAPFQVRLSPSDGDSQVVPTDGMACREMKVKKEVFRWMCNLW